MNVSTNNKRMIYLIFIILLYVPQFGSGVMSLSPDQKGLGLIYGYALGFFSR